MYTFETVSLKGWRIGYCVLKLLLSSAMRRDMYSHIYTCWVSFEGVHWVTWGLVGIFLGLSTLDISALV